MPLTRTTELPSGRHLEISRWLLLATLAAMPLYVIRWRLGPFPTTLLEALIWLTVLLYGGSYWQARRRPATRTDLDVPIVLLLVAGAIGVFIARDHVGALGHYRAFLIEPILLFYVAIDLLRRRRHIVLALGAMSIAGVAVAIANLGSLGLAVVQHHQINPSMAPVVIYTSQNEVAMFLEPVTAISVAFLLFGTRTSERWAGGFLGLLFVSTLILIFSRGGYLALGAIAIAAVFSVRHKLLVLGGSAAAALLVIWRVPHVAERLVHQLDPKYSDTTLAGRLVIWRAALRMLRDHPLFGAGLRSYRSTVLPYVPQGGTTDAIYPHNLWLTFWTELGLLGLLAFSVIFFTLLWKAWRAFRTAPGSYRPIFWAVFVSLVAIGVHGLVDTPYFKNDMSVEFWALAAVQMAGILALRSAAGQSPVFSPAPRAGIPAAETSGQSP